MRFTYTPSKNIINFFVFCVLIRTLYTFFFYQDVFLLLPDSHDYYNISTRLLHGEINFDMGRFIASPIAPIFGWLMMFVFGNKWEVFLIAFQILISSAGVFFIIRISDNLFKSKNISLIAGLLYSLYAPLFYFIFTFSQETLFLFLLFGFACYFLSGIKSKNVFQIYLSAIFLSLVYLTKSFILLFLPAAILILLFRSNESLKNKLITAVIFLFLFSVLPLMTGLINLKTKNEFVTSSNGGGLIFFTGNCELNYVGVCKTPPISSKEFLMISDPLSNYDKFQNFNQDSVAALPSKIRQRAYYLAGFEWIINNPEKFLMLKSMNLLRYFLPGNSWRHYPFKTWLLSFIVSLPLYLLGYSGLIVCLKRNFKEHLPMLLYFFTFAFMLTAFIFVNRYRTYLVDGLLILYASYFANILLSKFFPEKFSAA